MFKRAALLLTMVGGLSVETFGSDWFAWRGPEQTGVTRENAAVRSWSPQGENLLWHRDFGGRTTPIVFDGRVFFIAPVGEGVALRERVVCLNADSGETIWENRFNVFHTDIVENRVGWTAVAVDPETGYVFAHATGGEFFCWDRDGQLIWKRSLTEEFGRISGYGGRLHTPLVDEERVIVSFLNSGWGSHAPARHRYVAFDKRAGEVLWWAAPGGAPLDTTYSCPVVTVINGRRMLIAANADGNVYGMLARTGERIWSYRLSKRGINSSVVAQGNRVYVCHSEENLNSTKMGAIVCIDATGSGDITETGTVWRLDGYTVGYASPAIANGRLYVVSNNATLYSIDAATGEINWEYGLGRVGKGSPVVTADGVIYVGEQNGVFHILEDHGDRFHELDREEFTRPDGSIDEIFGSPAVAGGRVYFMTRYSAFCLGGPGAAVKAASAPRAADAQAHETEFPESNNGGGRLVIIPAELTLSPGESAHFTVRKLTSFGKPASSGAGEAAGLEWRVEGVRGEVAADGEFTAENRSAFSAGYVSVTQDGRTATARVRVSPRPPIREDFDQMELGGVPPGWIGVGRRVQIIEQGGNHVLQKIAAKERPSPPFMRLRAYATPPLPVGYTVQCEMSSQVRETARRSYQPDMGLINCRYRFIMQGGDPKRGRPGTLRIETWSPVPRLRRDVEYEWQADTWYVAKFEVKEVSGRAVCRAKVWPRGDEEPTSWQIELTDPYPNLEGSAGLYAYSTGTTAGSDGPATCFDNFQVYRDE